MRKAKTAIVNLGRVDSGVVEKFGKLDRRNNLARLIKA